MIQSLWHLSAFRELVIRADDSSLKILGAMRDTFIEYQVAMHTMHSLLCTIHTPYNITCHAQFADYSSISPDMLRQSLTRLSSEFKVGHMADANEALSLILSTLHEERGDCCDDHRCVAHSVFTGSALDYVLCDSCTGFRPALPMDEQYIRIAYAAELLAAAPSLSFSALLAPYMSDGRGPGDLSLCAACAGTRCFHNPYALAVSVVWQADHEDTLVLQRLYALIDTQLLSSELFRGDAARVGAVYAFRGMICYYGQHYVSIFSDDFFPHSDPRYLLFDDAHVRPLGDWATVKEECISARYQPVLLLYELQD